MCNRQLGRSLEGFRIIDYRFHQRLGIFGEVLDVITLSLHFL